MRIIHTADLHLDMPLSSLPPEKARHRREERRKSFSDIIDFTISSNADVLLISGDLFHTSFPSKGTLSFCAGEFARLGEIPVFIALGNHDYNLCRSYFPGNVRIFPVSFKTYDCGAFTVSGASFLKEECCIPLSKAKDNGKINLLCLHGDLDASSRYNPIDKDFITSLGYDYVALGHVHTYNRYKTAFYPGCHDAGGFDETGEKGFLSCLVTKTSLDASFIPSSTRIYEKFSFDISPFTSLSRLSEALSERLSGGVYSITLTGERQEGFSVNTSFLLSSLSEKAFHIVLSDKSRTKIDISENAMLRLVSEYLSQNCPELYDESFDFAVKALLGEEIII